MNHGLHRRPRLPGHRYRFPLSRLVPLVLFLFASIFCAGGARSSVAAVSAQMDISQLPITFPVQSPEVAAYFVEIARPGDIASVSPTLLHLIPQDTVGEKMVAFRSWTEAQSQLEALSTPVDWVMYNPEHWEFTPAEEQSDLVATVQEFADFCHAHNLRFMFTPDRQFAELYLHQVAPYVDAVMLQGQRLQDDPEAFEMWVRGMLQVARAANPDMQVFVQVGATRGTASDMYAAIWTVADDIDGIAIWSLPRTLPVLQEFVVMLQEGLPPEESAPASIWDITPTAPVSTETPAALPSQAAASAEPATSAETQAPDLATPSATQSAEAGVGPTPTPTEQNAAAVATEIVPSAVAPTAAPPPAQAERSAADVSWVTSLLLFVGGMGVGLILGFFLGWSLRRGSQG